MCSLRAEGTPEQGSGPLEKVIPMSADVPCPLYTEKGAEGIPITLQCGSQRLPSPSLGLMEGSMVFLSPCGTGA